MRSVTFAGRSRFAGVVIIAMSLIFSGVFSRAIAVQITDPTVHLSVAQVGQNVVVSWFGLIAVQYQLETSTNTTVWADVGPVRTGNDGSIAAVNPIGQHAASFFRVKRLFPAAPGSAAEQDPHPQSPRPDRCRPRA